MAMTCKSRGYGRLAYPIIVLTLVCATAAPARAAFFDDVRRTFTTDIPHFFQDDIPGAFGGQPTSHTRTSCKSAAHPAQHSTNDDRSTNTTPDKRPNYDP